MIISENYLRIILRNDQEPKISKITGNDFLEQLAKHDDFEIS
eukprot:UN21587